ncbi:MAG: hypothetical protein JF615_01330 [Asticcacaulis sp.]|nr:hypothetical protein [Asticcacaulis sp.]
MVDHGANSGASASLDSASHAATGTPAAAPDLSHAQKLIDLVNKHHDLQTQFTAAEKAKPPNYEAWQKFFEGVGKFFEAAGKLFAPLAPIMPYLLFLIAFAIVALLLSPVVRMFISTRFERLFTRDHLKAEKAWRPTKAAVVALLHDIDALAAAGQYDEAVHLLLVRSVADINNFRPDLVRLHYSARDICSHPLLPDAARPAFQQIVQWVEKSYFAGIAVGKAGFDACRQAYVAFVAAEGLA